LKPWALKSLHAAASLLLGCDRDQVTEQATIPLATATEQGPAPTALDACAGTWTGAGVQEGSSWTIKLVVAPIEGSGPCGSIDYPTLGCGGFIEGCALRPNGEVWMREVYTRNPGTCAPAGEILARCESGRMAWTWIGVGGPVTSTLLAE
jgi:hypothetical protein